MTKEELINNLRYTEKKHKNDIVNTFDTDISMMCSDVLKVLENCIEITDEMTNGDIIKLMFGISNDEISEDLSTVYVYTKTKVLKGGSQDFLRKQITFIKDWWNEPYKKGGEE